MVTPIQHPSNNSVLAAPMGISIDECRALAITRHTEDGIGVVTSFWKPEPEELAALNQGKAVMLTLWGVTHPPAMVRVEG